MLACMSDWQRTRVERALADANHFYEELGTDVRFEVNSMRSRGIEALSEAIAADVAVFGLEDGGFPGEASHLVAAQPDAKVVGVDNAGDVALVVVSVGGRSRRGIAETVFHLACGGAAHD